MNERDSIEKIVSEIDILMQRLRNIDDCFYSEYLESLRDLKTEKPVIDN